MGLTTGHSMEDRNDRLVIQSLMRALDVLEIFTVASKPMSLGEIAKASGVTKSGVQRIAHTLVKRGYLEQSQEGGLKPGLRMLDRSFDYLRLNRLVERAVPVLIELRRVTNERVDLSLFDHTRIVYASRQQSKRETFYATLIGRSVPTFCSSGGRACLAALPDSDIEDVLAGSELCAITPKTTTDPELIRSKIREARELGYALAAEEALIGEVVVAAAICDRTGRPMGAVHVAGSLSEWPVEEFRRNFAPLVIEAARALS
jgi:IclR family transcriptional regulator, pca regulon regulatory protein